MGLLLIIPVRVLNNAEMDVFVSIFDPPSATFLFFRILSLG